MEEKEITTSSARNKVSTGYPRLDAALQGGVLAGSVIVLSAPASDEVPLFLRNFLKATQDKNLLICRSLSSAQTIIQAETNNLLCLVCSDKPVPPSRNILPGKGIENLTELNLQISDAINSVGPKRVTLDILSDILLRHKALQTRKWLAELLERLRAKNLTALAVLNPNMHSSEEVEAVVDLFDGNLEMIEKETEGRLQKYLRIKWMHGIEAIEKEFPLLDMVSEVPLPAQPVSSPQIRKEPRWLTPLVSRTAETSKLRAVFEDALASKASVVALQGEAGVGKTRLMQELAVYAQSKGAAVLTGTAVEDGLPYGPWVEVARQYVAQTSGELLRRMLGAYASEFARLVPDIVAKLGTIPPSKSLGEQQDKIRLYEAVTQFFISISRESPLLLLFDDLHLADQASLDLLEYFVRSTSSLRVLTLCSYPAEQVDDKSPVYHVLMKFNKQRLLETVPVKDLSEEETGNLIKQIFGEQVSREFADLIYQRTGGNPFFVEEVLRSLVEDGTIFRTEKGWDRKPIQELVVPKSVKTILRSRLEKFDPETLNLLVLASVVGFEFDFEVLREVAQVDEDTLLQRLETVLASGLVLEPSKKGLFRFADNRIRELLLDDLSKIRRARYHLKIADAMEKIYSKSLDRQAELIANHAYEGGDTQRCIKYSITAADTNKAIYAYEPAIAKYNRALDLIDLEGGRDEEKAVVLENLAACCFFAGHSRDSSLYYKQALGIFEKLGDFKACARICESSSDAVYDAKGAGGPGAQEATLVVRQGLKYLEGDPESGEAAAIYSRLAWWLSILDRYEEANTWVEKGLEVGEKSKNFRAVATALISKASYLTDTGRIDEGLPLWERAVEVATQHEQYFQVLDALLNLSVYTYPRDVSKARDLVLRRIEVSKRVNDLVREARGYAWLAFLDWLKGDWTNALNEISKSFEVTDRLQLPPFFGSEEVRGWLHLTMGNLELAGKSLEAAYARKEPKITSIVLVNLVLGQLRLEQGREEEATMHLETCINAFKDWEFTTQPLLHVQTLLYLTSIYARHGALEKARKTSEWAKRIAETLKSDAGLAMVSQAEGNVLLASGDRKGAEEAYLKSLGLWEKAGWPYYRAKALVEYSEAMAKTNPEQSKDILAQATEIFQKLGAKRDVERAEAKISTQV